MTFSERKGGGGRPGRRLRRWAMMLGVALSGLGCAVDQADEGAPLPLPIQVLSDTGRTTTLAVEPPLEGAGAAPPPGGAGSPDPQSAARVWLARVTPAPPDGGGPPLPEPGSDSLELPASPPALDIDPGLEPPILRRAVPLIVPQSWTARHRGRKVSVELDVLVGEGGEVSEVEWAGGTRDSMLVEAATRCAAAMTFYPALKRGYPVAVWCRQRFDFGGR